MKLITYEMSDCSIAITTLSRLDGQWECSLIHSIETEGIDKSIQRRKSFGGLYNACAALELTIDFTNSYIETFYEDLDPEALE